MGDNGESSYNVFTVRKNHRAYHQLIESRSEDRQYISDLEKALRESGIEIPIKRKNDSRIGVPNSRIAGDFKIGILSDGGYNRIKEMLLKVEQFHRKFEVQISFKDMGYCTMLSEPNIRTVGSTFRNIFVGSGPKRHVDILKGITGRILSGKLTLVLGPPGSGKTVFLKALSGRLHSSQAELVGSISYNGDTSESGNFLLPKVVDYIDQKDCHAGSLSVAETMEFAWKCSTGGHHSYGYAKDEASKVIFNQEDSILSRMNNILLVLGINGCRDTMVGDASTRGISGGQKRRVTVGEMMVCPRSIRFMDSISNGLDAATTYDIIRALKIWGQHLDHTHVISLLQPPPEVFNLFDEIILMSEGQVIYHSMRVEVLNYFEGIGYTCPSNVDVADFLQELPTREGKRFIRDDLASSPKVPRGTDALVSAWKCSLLYGKMTKEIEFTEALDKAVYAGLGHANSQSHWPPDFQKEFSASFFYHFDLILRRQWKILIRDSTLIKSRVAQCIVVGVVAASLFSNIGVTDTDTMDGFLFFAALFNALAYFDIIPTVYAQREVYYKQADAKFYPAFAFALAQSFVYYPMHISEGIVFGTMAYWSAGLSGDDLGSRFLIFILICIMFAICIAQFFRLIACVMPDIDTATPVAGVVPVILVLFSGYIQAYNNISYGWTWFYWLNPIAWTLKALSVNEYTSRKYDFPYCLDDACTENIRFGDYYLNSKGNPTDRKWIWYSFAVLVAEYILFVVLSAMALKYLRLTPAPPPPIKIPPDLLLMSEHEGNNFNCREEEEIWNEEKVDVGHKKDPGNEAVMNLSEYDEEIGIWVESRPVENIKGDANSKSPTIDGIRGVEATGIGNRISRERGRKLDFEVKWEGSSGTNSDVVHDLSEEMIAIKERRRTRKASMNNTSLGAMIGDTEIPFEPVSFAFKDLCYSVVLPGGHELELLRNVTGFFEPGTLTALMGSSGAGKTTLLDVLSGRKTSGVVKGGIFVNGYPKSERHFRRNMGYVEQFDSLSPQDTAKEAITFSAAMRLPNGTTQDQRNNWVDTILVMLELTPLISIMVGSQDSGGMSFEQKKRLSIGVELAANPSILFLDEPTTGLDSRAAQVVIRSLRRVALSGRSIVCTIHQPSSSIFNGFDSLLLLKRGGQTAFFGKLGEECCNLVDFFQSAKNVVPIRLGVNPASWMLETIGAGTNTVTSDDTVDFHVHYKASELCATNTVFAEALCTPNMPTNQYKGHDHDQQMGMGLMAGRDSNAIRITSRLSFATLQSLYHTNTMGLNQEPEVDLSKVQGLSRYNASYLKQLRWLTYRATLSYWRTPNYNLIRFLINIVIALIFASAYANQQYGTALRVRSRSAVIFITCLFCGAVSMQSVCPVAVRERPAFYREQQSNMYSVGIYSFAYCAVELPYLMVSSLVFTLPFFYIIGFQYVGNPTVKFFWYWLFHTLYMTVLVGFGQFLAAVMPSENAAQVAMGMITTLIEVFCGFYIKQQNFPTFWTFMYWLNPLHYCLEGLNMTQFHDDSTKVLLADGTETSAQNYINTLYSSWKYGHVHVRDVTVLIAYILLLRFVTYLALANVKHESR